jgi:hypothetical protein
MTKKEGASREPRRMVTTLTPDKKAGWSCQNKGTNNCSSGRADSLSHAHVTPSTFFTTLLHLMGWLVRRVRYQVSNSIRTLLEHKHLDAIQSETIRNLRTAVKAHYVIYVREKEAVYL